MPKRQQPIALVTGANKGIGFEVVRQLARKRFHVFLGARNVAAGQAAAEKLQQDGNVTFIEIDVSNRDSINRSFDAFSLEADHLDVLVNNAAIALDEDKDILKVSADII